MGSDRSWLTITAVSLAVVSLLFIGTQPQVANDFWLQAKIGELIARNGTFPATLLFPFTPAAGYHFNIHEWIPSLLFFGLIQIGGEASLPIALGLAAVGLWALCVRFATSRSGGNIALGMLCGLVALLTENFRHFLRPELVSLFCLLFYWLALERIRADNAARAWVAAACISVLWGNTHGSFVLAPVMAGVYAVGLGIDHWRMRPLTHGGAGVKAFAALSALVAACSLVNPMGLDMWHFVLHFGTQSSAKLQIMEWMPSWDPRLHKVAGLSLGLAVNAMVATLCLRHWRRLSSVDLLLALMFLVMGLLAVRFLVYAGFTFAYIAARVWGDTCSRPNHQRRLYAVLGSCAIGVLLFASHYGNMNGNFPHRSDSSEVLSAPMAAVIASERLTGNVYNSYDLGAELAFRAYPRLRPSIDSRIDSYGDAYFDYHESLLHDRVAMDRFVQDYDVRHMLLTRTDFDELQANQPDLQHHWEIQLADQRAVLLTRRK